MNEVVLVTGASAGIGLASADRMHDQGWNVFGASRRGISPGGWTPLAMDVDSDDSVATGFASLLARHHRIDAVVACAGWGLAGPAERTPMADAHDQLETNFWGAVRVVQHALPVMRRQRRGRLVLISSIGGIVAIPFQAFYSASKFALEGYGEALAYEVAPFNIQVTLVEPGNVRTEFTERRRDVGAPASDPAYSSAVAKAVGTMAADEAAGVAPDRVAVVVQRALEARNPPRRVSVGKIDERIGIMAKRVMPYRIFERAARRNLGV
ncbi:MAG TPA: SDR family oxidoreductase [Acidimicrobiales bacterium]|nr:SDR family oxidoreductase [Acidimicrobiales bacterium]